MQKIMVLRRRQKVLLYGILLIGVFAPLGFSSPQLKIESPARKISLQQTLTLKIRLQWPAAEGPYEINSQEPKLENLALEKQNQSQETGSSVFHTITYEFRPLKSGTAVIYPFEVHYRKSGIESWTSLGVPEQNVQVTPKSLAGMALISFGMLSALAGLVLAGFKVHQVLKKRATLRNLPPSDPRQRIYAKTEESIATFASPDAKEKLTHWSHQLRVVVATYYGLTAQTTTNAEILSLLKSREIPAGERNEISRLFEQLNEMQFSRQDIPAHDMDGMKKTLLQYVKGKIIIGNL